MKHISTRELMLYVAINLITRLHDVSDDQQTYNAQYRFVLCIAATHSPTRYQLKL